jgi:ApbE superfamily uncharacterized protein (UPF0280 family)
VLGFQPRSYRLECGRPELVPFTARVKETDLWLLAESNLADQAVEAILFHRRGLEAYLTRRPQAAVALTPLPDDPLAPAIMRKMLAAGRAAGTGPMAGVAGAIAEAVARDLMKWSRQIIVENGGDLYLQADSAVTVGIHAGDSPLSGRLGLLVEAGRMPLAMGTSSGTVGHSLSLGRADAATVVARDGALADACATALGNRVKQHQDMAAALDWVQTVEGVSGAVLVLAKHLAAWGEVELVDLRRRVTN